MMSEDVTQVKNNDEPVKITSQDMSQTILPYGVNVIKKDDVIGAKLYSNAGGSGYITRAFQTPQIATNSIVDSITPKDLRQLHALFRSIHRSDPTVPQAIDLLSTIPFGNFSLAGCDHEILEIYNQCMEELNIENYLTEYCRDFLVLGKVCLHLIFDKTRGIWTDIIQHDPDYIELTPVPLANFSPFISLMPNDVLRNFALQLYSDKRLARLRNKFDQQFITQLAKGNSIELPESNTAYIARKIDSQDYEGTSIYTRILGLVFYEYALLNGNIDTINRRIGPIRLVSIPSSESNGAIPQWEELEGICNALIQADRDPVTAYVAMQRQVNIDSIPVGEHIRLSEDWDMIQQAKMRALGVSEEFLTGNTTFGSMETAFSMFTERIKNLRSYFEQKLFYEKIFEPIARVHKFYKRTEAELAHNIRSNGWIKAYGSLGSNLKASYRNSSNLILPTVNWFNGLTPTTDEGYLTFLSEAEKRGLPINLKMWASAFGFKFDDLINNADSDKNDWEKLAKYNEVVGDAKAKAGVGNGDDDDGFGSAGMPHTFSLKSAPETLEKYYENLRSHKFYKNGKFLDSSPENIAKVYDALRNKDLLNDNESLEIICGKENVSPAVFKYALSELNVANLPLTKDDTIQITSEIMNSDNPVKGSEFWEITNKLNSMVNTVKQIKDNTNKMNTTKFTKNYIKKFVGGLKNMGNDVFSGIK